MDDYLRYTNEGYNKMVDMVDINANNFKSINNSLKFLRRNKKVFMKEFLRSGNTPNIASIYISP